MAHKLLEVKYEQRHSSDLAILMVLRVALYSTDEVLSLKIRKPLGNYHPNTNEYPWTLFYLYNNMMQLKL